MCAPEIFNRPRWAPKGWGRGGLLLFSLFDPVNLVGDDYYLVIWVRKWLRSWGWYKQQQDQPMWSRYTNSNPLIGAPQTTSSSHQGVTRKISVRHFLRRKRVSGFSGLVLLGTDKLSLAFIAETESKCWQLFSITYARTVELILIFSSLSSRCCSN